MNFIDRLIPFLEQEIFRENLLTAIWVIILIGIFIGVIFYLWLKYVSVTKNIKINNLPNRKLKKIWDAYKASFFNFDGYVKTTELSEYYFNEQSILYSRLNYRAVNNFSNILIGFGILGTFVGLTYGIADSNFETAEAIKTSIDNLLSGMGTAFVTSIWGMGLSLIYTIIFKTWQSAITKKILNLNLALNKEYKIKQEEFEAYQQQKQRNIIIEIFNDYLVAETDEGKQLPKNVFRQLLEESVKQTSSLQSFVDDLPKNLEIVFEKMLEDNSQQISNLIEEKLVPVLEDLKQIKQDSGTKVIENAVNRLADSMKAMMEDFKTTVTNDTKQEMENLIQRLTTVSESLASIPDSMTDITLQVAETIEALKDTVIENINQSRAQVNEINQRNLKTFTNANNEYKTTVEDIQSHMELLLSSQKDNIKQVYELTDGVKAIIIQNQTVGEQFDSVAQKSKAVAQLIESVSHKLENNSQALSDTSGSLNSSLFKFNETIDNYLNKNEDIINRQTDALQRAQNVASDFSQRFTIIEQGLNGIFNQIQTGLSDYQKVTAANLNEYLTSFSSTLSKAHEGLEKTVSGLYDINEELTDQIDKLIKR